jgi:hypothetical protein
MAAKKTSTTKKKAPAKRAGVNPGDLDAAFEIRIPAAHLPADKRAKASELAADAIRDFVDQHETELKEHVRKAVPGLESSDFAFKNKVVKQVTSKRRS